MAVLIQYNGSGVDPSTTATNVVGSSIRVDAPSTSDGISIGTLGYVSDPAYAILPDSTATSAATAITNDCYTYFNLTPAITKCLTSALNID